MNDEYFVAISIDGQVVAKEWCESLVVAKEWGESYPYADDYTITIFKNADEEPVLKYDKKGLF
jgi:hypothetical protein